MDGMFLKYLILLVLTPFALSTDAITSSISVTSSSTVISKEGKFALGFFSPGNSKYKYLGIWYHNLPGQTVVWVANRNNPINDSSGVLSVHSDGNLVLYDRHHQEFPLWSTNVSVKGTDRCVAQLLDSGNLVLIGRENKRIIWQSFDYPTDTWLPGMKLGFSQKIGLNWSFTSWRSTDNPGSGNWSIRLNPNGSPQTFLYNGITPYWRSVPWPLKTATLDGFVASSTYNKDEIYLSYRVSDESIITRLVVNSSGLYQRITWDNSSSRWIISRSEPKFPYGQCGAYSMLNPNNNVDSLNCMCLPGYEPKSLKKWYLIDGSAGCLRKRQQTMSMCRNGEGFVKVGGVKVPDASISAVINTSLSTLGCEQFCLTNCSCKAYSINEDGCLTWFGELMDTRQYTEGRDLYVRVDSVELASYEKNKRGFLKEKGKLVIPMLSASVVVFLIGYLWVWKKWKSKVKKKAMFSGLVENELVESRHAPDMAIISLPTISAATNRFSPANKLGQGGFGPVYKGQLQDGQEIAVKRLSQCSKQGITEFKNEVMLIVRLQHRNLVKLLGCCIEQDERMLVYEYLPNKSLDYFIFDHERRLSALNWSKCFDIIIGIARGLLYLHQDSRLRIIHRDLKTSNVLLDADMNPKISDFGMARIFRGDEVQDETNQIVGTYGYIAPEYAACGKFSTKSDVFSFGIILLEILSGKKSNSFFPEDSALILIGHVWELWRKGRAMDILDSSLTDSTLPPEVYRCIQVALLCIEEDAAERPTMATVVVMLNGETVLPSPKQPAFILRRTSNDPKSLIPAEGSPSSINEVTTTNIEAR